MYQDTRMHQLFLLLCVGLQCYWCSTHVHPRNVLLDCHHLRGVSNLTAPGCTGMHQWCTRMHHGPFGGAALWCTPREQMPMDGRIGGVGTPACTSCFGWPSEPGPCTSCFGWPSEPGQFICRRNRQHPRDQLWCSVALL